MQYFKKYDFVNFYVNDKLDRITYVSDVESSDGKYRICVDDGWYDVTHTGCIRVEKSIQCELKSRIDIHTVNHMITRCTKDDIDKALNDERIDIEYYQECIKLRRKHGIIPTNYND